MDSPDGTPDFYTAGYQGRDIDSFVSALLSAGVACLFDVRFNPVSMYKPAFSRKNLEARLSAAGIDYVHMPDLGVPSDVRGLAAFSGRREDIWDWYDEHVLAQYAADLGWFFNTSDHPVAIMCMERDRVDCHRHRLAGVLEKQGLTSLDI